MQVIQLIVKIWPLLPPEGATNGLLPILEQRLGVLPPSPCQSEGEGKMAALDYVCGFMAVFGSFPEKHDCGEM